MKARNRKKQGWTEAADSRASFATRLLFVSLCVSFGLETLLFWPAFGNAYTVPKVAAVLVGAGLLLPQICLRLLRFPLSRAQKVLLALCGIQLLAGAWSTANSMSPAVSFWGGDWRRMGWITQFAMLTMAMAAPLAIGRDSRRWERLLLFIAGIGALSAAYGILQWLGWDPFLPESLRAAILSEFAGHYRSSGTIGQPTYYATCLLYALFAALALVVSQTRARRAFAGLALLLIAGALGSTGARSGWFGAAAGGGFFVIWALWYRRASIRLNVGIAAILAAVLIAAAFLASGYGIHMEAQAAERIPGLTFVKSRLAGMNTDSASIGRIVLWDDVLHRILPRLWLSGAGPGMFRVAFTRYRSNSYSEFSPDVHWESAHNLFLDRFTEQGILGLASTLAWLIVFVHGMTRAIRMAPDRKTAAAYAACACGLAAVLVSQFFNGEVIPTATCFFLWIAIGLSARDCVEQPNPGHTPAPTLSWTALAILCGAVAISIGMIRYAERNWRAETMLRAGEIAVNAGNGRGLLMAKNEAEAALPQVGTYHLEFARLIATFLSQPRSDMDRVSRRRVADAGIAAGEWAIPRTDKPMLALQHLIVLADLTGDARMQRWNDDLRNLDPYWFRPHEVSARLLLRQGRIDEALREATIARQLAPYVRSSADVWNQLLAMRRERGRD